MAHVISGVTGAATGAADVTVNVGSASDRKALALIGVQDDAGDVTAFTVERDPTGTPEGMTAIGGVQTVVFDGTDYRCQMFRLDLSVTGSQTFRGTVATGTDSRKILGVSVHDGLAAGAPEAGPESVGVNGTQSSISDSITTVSANAVIVPLAFVTGWIGAGADRWVPLGTETVHIQGTSAGIVSMVLGSEAIAVAGAETVGYVYEESGTPTNFEAGLLVTAAFAPAASGLSIPVAMHHYNNLRRR